MGAVTRNYENGEILFKEGDRPDGIYLIQKGSVSIRKRRGASQVELARMRNNEVIGELAFFDRQPRSATAIALTKTEVMVIPFEALDKIYSSVPAYFKTIMAAVSERLRRADEMIRKLEKNTMEDHEGIEPADDPEQMLNAGTAEEIKSVGKIDPDAPDVAKTPVDSDPKKK